MTCPHCGVKSRWLICWKSGWDPPAYRSNGDQLDQLPDATLYRLRYAEKEWLCHVCKNCGETIS